MPNWSATSAPYLAKRPPEAGDAWAEEAAGAGHVGTQKIIDTGEHHLPPDVREALGTAQTSAILRRRLVLADDVPVEVVDSWWPLSVAGDTPLARKQKIPGGTPGLLASLGYVPQRVIEEIAAPRASQRHQVVELLGLNPFDQVLEVTRTLLSEYDLPFEVTVMSMVPRVGTELRRVRYELTLD